jgi:glycerol-3-phosphate cytidylyltransferase
MGHANFLRQCNELGFVVVGVNTDKFVETYKGERPAYTMLERIKAVRNMGYEVWPNHTAGKELVLQVRPDFIAIGSDWMRKDYFKQIDMQPEDLDNLGIGLIYIPYTQGISTTDIKHRLEGGPV